MQEHTAQQIDKAFNALIEIYSAQPHDAVIDKNELAKNTELVKFLNDDAAVKLTMYIINNERVEHFDVATSENARKRILELSGNGGAELIEGYRITIYNGLTDNFSDLNKPTDILLRGSNAGVLKDLLADDGARGFMQEQMETFQKQPKHRLGYDVQDLLTRVIEYPAVRQAVTNDKLPFSVFGEGPSDFHKIAAACIPTNVTQTRKAKGGKEDLGTALGA